MRLQHETLQALKNAICKDATRYNLSAIHVTPDALHATDGHRLHTIRAVSPEEHTPEVPPFLLSRETALELLKVLPRKNGIATVAHVEPAEGGNSEVRATWSGPSGDGALTGKRTEGDFPDVAQIQPSEPAESVACFNAKYLRDVCDAALRAFPGEKLVNLRVELRGVSTAARFVAEPADAPYRFEALLMPRRD